MKLNDGTLLVESLLALLVSALVINLLLSFVKLNKVEEDVYRKHEERIHDT